MGLRPTHRDESPFLRFIDSKQVTRDFRRSANWLHQPWDDSRSGAVTGATIVDANSLLWRDLKHSPAANETAACTTASVLSRTIEIASFIENQRCGGIFSVWNSACKAVEHREGPVSILLLAEPENVA